MLRNWRSLLLRSLLGRLRIDDDTIKHLSTFQRLGETLEVTPPIEMLPVGARTMLRAVRTRAAVQIRPDWVWPYWLQRQIDPRSPSFVPRGHLPFASNVTHRNWTMVGNCDSAWEAIVDPRGLVTPWFDGWSLDWGVVLRGEAYFAAGAREVNQSLLHGAPVVRTSMPTPAGELREDVYAVEGDEELVIAEVTNCSKASVNVLFSVRPYNPEGLAVVEHLQLRGREVLVEGRAAVALDEGFARTVLGTFSTGDSFVAVARGASGSDEEVRDRAGLAQASFAYHVEPGRSVRAAMPLRRERRRKVVQPPPIRISDRIARPPEVARAWRRQLERGMRVRLPDERLQHAVEANRAFMLLFLDRDEITPGPYTYHRFWFRDAAYQLVALDRWGFADEAARVLRSFPRRQRGDGFFYSQWREWDSNGAAIWALAEHHRLTGDDALLRDLSASVAKGAEWIARKRKERKRDASELRGLMPAGVSAEHLGPYDYYYWDAFWSLRGLLDAAYVLEKTDRRAEAVAARAEANALRDSIFFSLELVASRLGRRLIPAGPTRAYDAAMVGSLAACYPLGLLDAGDEWIRSTVDVVRSRFTIGDALFQGISHTGLGTYLTLQLAFVELESGDRHAWDRMRWMLESATSTFTWPEAIHPRTGGGCMGDGHHGWAAADFLSFVRHLLVRERRDGSLALLSLLPPGWEGRDVEVHDAVTHAGVISFSLSWRAERPRLEWTCDREVELGAPGLDPSWRARGRAGEAVLQPLGPAGAA